jgi:hypothetical protein
MVVAPCNHRGSDSQGPSPEDVRKEGHSRGPAGGPCIMSTIGVKMTQSPGIARRQLSEQGMTPDGDLLGERP